MTMNPPPPMPQAYGRTTERAKEVATAASTALPLCRWRISAPAADAAGCAEATAACGYGAGDPSSRSISSPLPCVAQPTIVTDVSTAATHVVATRRFFMRLLKKEMRGEPQRHRGTEAIQQD